MFGPHPVVDAHCHLGLSVVSGVDISEAALLRGLADYGVDTAMVMPQPQQDLGVVEAHDRIARLAEAHPCVIYGMASLSPRLPETAYRREATRCVRELGFRALKLDPAVHALAANHPRCEIIFATARELGVPVIIHTAGGFALPSLAIPPAQHYADVTIVLAHAGFVTYTGEAIIAAQLCPNMILEPSWCLYGQVADMVRKVGAGRVMYGSDHVKNIPIELAKLQVLELNRQDLGQVLAGTARRVFKLPA